MSKLTMCCVVVVVYLNGDYKAVDYTAFLGLNRIIKDYPLLYISKLIFFFLSV